MLSPMYPSTGPWCRVTRRAPAQQYSRLYSWGAMGSCPDWFPLIHLGSFLLPTHILEKQPWCRPVWEDLGLDPGSWVSVNYGTLCCRDSFIHTPPNKIPHGARPSCRGHGTCAGVPCRMEVHHTTEPTKSSVHHGTFCSRHSFIPLDLTI